MQHRARRRSRLETLVEVLRICEKESLPTRIMYAANLSWKPLHRNLSALVRQGLIREEGPSTDRRTRRVYYLTDEGRNVLRWFLESGRRMGLVEDDVHGERGRRAAEEPA